MGSETQGRVLKKPWLEFHATRDLIDGLLQFSGDIV